MSSIVLTNENQNLAVNYQYTNPVGSIICYAGPTAPPGWLFCDGSEVSKATYSALYSIVGLTYGVPSDSNHFVLPDLRQRFPLGKSSSNSLSGSGGNPTATLTTNELPAHTHTGTTNSDGTHSHIATDAGHTHPYDDAYFAENQSGGTNIYGTSSGTDTDNDYIYRSPQPTTDIGNANITVDTSGAHTHGFTTGSTGSGASFSIMNPYLVLNYLIRH